MNGIVTQAIVLSRIDFGEADRILTLLTPDQGKISAMAKGVRKVKSKLAGGIELFSESSVTYIPGKGDIATLISTRLITYYDQIVKDIDRTMLGYDLIKLVNKSSEDEAGEEYYDLLKKVFVGLNDLEFDQRLTELWCYMRLLSMSGHLPNLSETVQNQKLNESDAFLFDYESSKFQIALGGKFTPRHIKLLRLAAQLNSPRALGKVTDLEDELDDCLQLAKSMVQYVFSKS
jgi:DNA repair protein RecO (recombination protein O)